MTSPVAELFFDANEQFGSLELAMKSICKGTRTFTDPCISGALPAWQTCPLGTLAFPTGYFGGSGVAEYKITTATAASSRGILRNSNSSRAVSDGVTNATTTVTSATAAFTTADVLRPISGGTIPAGSIIIGWNSATSVTVSAPASGSATSVALTIGAAPTIQSITPSNFVALAWTLEGLVFDASTGYDFIMGFVAPNTFGGIQAQQLQNEVGGEVIAFDGSGNQIKFPRVVTDGVTTAGSTVLTSATANFTSVDLHQPIGNQFLNGNPPVPLIAGATIASVDSTTQVHTSLPAIANGTGLTVAIGQQPYFRPFSTLGGGQWRKNFTVLWLPLDGYFYILRDDQVVAEVNTAGYPVQPTTVIEAQAQITTHDGAAHSFSWTKSQLILGFD